MIEQINWEGDELQIIAEIFSLSKQLTKDNAILKEWYNPTIAPYLKSYYASAEGMEKYNFHAFLIELFSKKLFERGYSESDIQKLGYAIELIYKIEVTSDRQDARHAEALETLTTYFIKGILS